MANKRIAQFRYFGDNNSNFNSQDKDAIYHQLDNNQPNGLTMADLCAGTAFTDYTPIIQLGIQALPGTKFNLNTNLDPIVIGTTGIYELDLTDSSAVITSLTFEQSSIEYIQSNPDGYLIIDIVYQEV